MTGPIGSNRPVGPVGSGGPRPGELTVRDRDGLVAQFAEARRSRDWTRLAGSLVRARAWGVRVAALSAVLGVNAERVRAICRDHGPDPATVRDPLAGAGWVDTPAAAAVLGVPGQRLLAYRVQAERDGVAVMAGWTRRWNGPSLPGWWAQWRVELRTPQQLVAEDRRARVRALVAAGATVPGAAAEVGVSPSLAYRYLRDSPVHRVSSVGS